MLLTLTLSVQTFSCVNNNIISFILFHSLNLDRTKNSDRPLYSKIEESRLAIYSIDNENFHGQNAAIFEQARTFRVLFTHPSKNSELR